MHMCANYESSSLNGVEVVKTFVLSANADANADADANDWVTAIALLGLTSGELKTN